MKNICCLNYSLYLFLFYSRLQYTTAHILRDNSLLYNCTVVTGLNNCRMSHYNCCPIAKAGKLKKRIREYIEYNCICVCVHECAWIVCVAYAHVYHPCTLTPRGVSICVYVCVCMSVRACERVCECVHMCVCVCSIPFMCMCVCSY